MNDEQKRIMAEYAQTAVYRLATHKMRYPNLGMAEYNVRLALAEAIIEMDDADAEMQFGASLDAQAKVERLKDEYAQALADLVRGDDGSEGE